MKKLFILITTFLFHLSAMAGIVPVEPSLENGYFLISSPGNFVWFAQNNNSGSVYANGKLTADIDLGDDLTMIGTRDNPFCGTFDGDGHIITVNYTATENNAAPFSFVKSATINNLRTAGSITTGYKFAGGIVAECSGITKINNCSSSIAITNTYTTETDGTYGGIVGNNQNILHLNNVLFNGKLLGPKAKKCGGLVGWSKIMTTISNGLFCPSEVTFSATDSKTLSRGNNVSVNNCFYSVALGETQGTATTDLAIASGEICFKLNCEKTDGTQVWYQNIDNNPKDIVPVLNKTHGTVYGGDDQCPANSYSNTRHTHTFGEYDQTGKRTCTVCSFVDYSDPIQDASGFYLIANRKHLIWFAQRINNGNIYDKGKLTADIDLGYDQTMIGTSNKRYAGTFDGDGHTITVNYVATEDNTALFRYVWGATIKNLKTAGKITTGYKFAAGIVSVATSQISSDDDVTYIENCSSDVTIESIFSEKQEGKHGGILAHGLDYFSLNNVLFTGKLIGDNATHCGGLVGIKEGGGYCYVKNSLFSPAEVTFNAEDSKTLAGGNLNIDNSFYTKTIGEIQGTEAVPEAMASGLICHKLNGGKSDGSQHWYQNIDNGKTVDATPVPFKTHGTVYGGETQCPINSFSNTKKPHTEPSAFEDGVKYCTVCNHEIEYEAPDTDDSGYYYISNKGHLCWFGQKVNGGNTGIKGRLMADINLGNSQMMIGPSNNHFSGTFDGNGHTVTVNYTAKENNTALFCYVNGATIKNLKTSGNITTGYQFAAGIVSCCYGETNITECASDVTIKSTFTVAQDGTHGGIVALNQEKVYLTNVLYNGRLLGENATNCGGLVGWSENYCSMKNCLFAPSEVTFSASNAKTLIRERSAGDNDNCYYTQTLGDAQGTQATDAEVSDGSLVNKLNSAAWMQDATLGMPVPFRQMFINNKNLKLTAQGDGTITVVKTGTVEATLEYITEESMQWTTLAYGTPISLNEGQSIWLRAKGTNGKNATLNKSDSNYLTFTSTMDVAASQNIMSLLDASCEQTEVPSYAFMSLFSKWTHLTQAPELPGTVLHSYCYASMFEHCTGLTSIPDLSHASLAYQASRACQDMFLLCSNIKINTLGLGSEWKIQMEDTRTNNMNNFDSMFFGTGGNFTDKPEKDVTYYIYNDEPYTRQMTNKWGTIVLPFAVAYDAENTNHKLYHLTAADRENLTFTEYETDIIPAGTPMVVKAIGAKGGDDKYTISIPSAKGRFSGIIKAQNTENAGLPESWAMTGTYTTTSIGGTEGNGVYFIAADAFWRADAATEVVPFRAWFTGPASTSSAKAFNIVIDEDETSAISDIENDTLNMVNGTSAEGKYLENGRIVIRKGGKKYNTQGQLLK